MRGHDTGASPTFLDSHGEAEIAMSQQKGDDLLPAAAKRGAQTKKQKRGTGSKLGSNGQNWWE
jgi:hypothetical protein